MFKGFFDFSRSPVLNFFRPKKKKEEKKSEKDFISVPLPHYRLVDAAKTLIIGWDSKDKGDLDGEFKRHQVYAKMIKIFPHENRRHISFVIELVINEYV